MATHDEITSKALEIIRADIALTERWEREERPGNPFLRGTYHWRLYNECSDKNGWELRRALLIRSQRDAT